jgi:hypothetical protein
MNSKIEKHNKTDVKKFSIFIIFSKLPLLTYLNFGSQISSKAAQLSSAQAKGK